MGRTIRLMEEAIELLGEIPEDHRVYITGAHTRWLLQLEREFKEAGLVDVKFVPVQSVLDGRLNGLKGVLLTDDFQDLTYEQQKRVWDVSLVMDGLRLMRVL